MEVSRSESQHVTTSPEADGKLEPRPDAPPASGHPAKPHLGLFDAVAIIIGIVIGSTIYKSPQLIMLFVTEPWIGLAAWGLGGVLSLIGALCYAELASTYPRSGGDYVYLSRAFGNWAGFLFGWAQLAVILTASIGAMAFVFGDYAVKVWPPPATVGPQELTDRQKELAKGPADAPELKEVNDEVRGYTQRRELWTAAFAVVAVVVLSLTNVLGVVLGKWTQNILSLLKVIGLGAIVVIGFKYGTAEILAGPPEEGLPGPPPSFGLAMIFVLYAYGGWNDAAFVAAEVRNRRNIVRALLLGTAVITVIYLAVNLAYLRTLGFKEMRESGAVAAAVGQKAFGDTGSLAISILVMVSALGA